LSRMADALTAPSPAPADHAIQARVEAELTRLLYRLAGFGLFSNFALALILMAGVGPYYPLRWSLAWLAAILAVSVARWLLNRSFARQPRTDTETVTWRRWFIAGAVVA